jgi:hypothetical protein
MSILLYAISVPMTYQPARNVPDGTKLFWHDCCYMQLQCCTSSAVIYATAVPEFMACLLLYAGLMPEAGMMLAGGMR